MEKLNQLPAIGLTVKALCRCNINRPKALGGSSIIEKTVLIRRIKSKSNSQGWQWSHKDIETYFTWGSIVT